MGEDMKKIHKWVLGLTILFIISYFAINYLNIQIDSETTVTKTTEEEQRYVNLVAFAKLFGYVRYFHPSDESTEMNWNRFAVYGAEQVAKAKDKNQLISVLEDLFLPIAPLIVIDNDNSEKSREVHHNEKEVIAWQHYGVGTEDLYDLYKSKRVTASINGDQLLLEDNKLFEQYPKINEMIIKEIIPGLNVKIPLVLYLDEGKTVGSDEESLVNFKKLQENLKQIDSLQDSNNEFVRFAGVVVTWNILQHFFPYFHVTNSDWEAQLEISLIDAENDHTREDYIRTLSRLLEKTKDGHAELANSKYNRLDKRLPFVVDIIEGHVVVTAAEKESGLLLGDIILSMNDRKALGIIEQLESEIVGSPQNKKHIATVYFTIGDIANLEVLRENETISLKIDGKSYSYLDEFNRKETFQVLEEGIYYLNLTSADAPYFIETHVEQLTNAKGIIFDLRGYPASFAFMHDVIGHLIDEPIKGPIFRIPQTIYPDQEQVIYDEIQDSILPKEPKFNGEIVFLTYNGAISMSEFFLGYIKDNQIAEIVGQPTAGSDGDANRYLIPGNITGVFTGSEVLNADRSQTHTIGIEPTVPIERTIDGVKQGVDEYIQKALKIINN